MSAFSAVAGLLLLALLLLAGNSVRLAEASVAPMVATVVENDVEVSASNDLTVNPPQDLPHTETITLTVRNGDQPGQVHASVSLIGAAVCDPQLEPEAADGNSTDDVLMGPIVLAGLQATRLDFFELSMEPNEVRDASRDYALTCPPGGPHTLQVVVNVDSESPDPNILNNQDENHPVVTVCCPDVDSDGVPNGSDVCATVADPSQTDSDGDQEGDACDQDDDNDGVLDKVETACGSNSLNTASLPERIDTPGDDNGDTQVNEALPPAAAGQDCDGDGFSGEAETIVTTSDQDPCGAGGWPADLAGNDNRLEVADLSSFLFPLRGDGSFNKFGHSVPDPQDPVLSRWDLEPNGVINVGDLNALNPGGNSPTSHPPMLNGRPAFFTNGGQCPFPP